MLDASPLPLSSSDADAFFSPTAPGPVAAAADWRQTLRVGDIVSFRFPVEDVEGGPAKNRPCLVLEVEPTHAAPRITLAYHWIIGRDGRVLPGRPETVIGAGVEGHNAGVIHCCLIGGHGSAATDTFARHFTPAQDAAARHLIAGICLRTQINRITGHNDYAAKACPGFTVSKWLKGA